MEIKKKPTILLIASQMPQQELGLIAQLLQSQGFARKQAPADQSMPSLVFATDDQANAVTMKYYQDVDAIRLELAGEVSLKIGAALGQYMEPLTASIIAEYYHKTPSEMERRIYAILMVLTYADAADAMGAMRKSYFDEADEATREGVVQGLAFLASPDVGTALESIERDFKGQNIAALARKAIDGLSERGVIRESEGSFVQKMQGMIESNPKSALEQIEKYVSQGAAPGVRALHAKALRLLGKNDEAGKLLEIISIRDPDAADAFCERALLREASGFAQQALNDAQTALTIDSGHSLGAEIFKRLNLVLSHSSSSNEDKLEQYHKAIEANPDDPNLRCQRAECYIAMRRSAEAIKDLQAAQKLVPNDPRLPILLCEAYLEERCLGSALDQATRARSNHIPTNAVEAWLLKPRVFLAIGDAQKALASIHEIPADLRENPQVVFCTAIILEMNGKASEALSFYKTHQSQLKSLYQAVSPVLYQDLPMLRQVLGADHLEVRTRPAQTLDKEPVDPYFKRCDYCGALTMKRRTNCRECGGATFFE